MNTRIIAADVTPLCYPTSLLMDGSDPRHLVPDYAAVELRLVTSGGTIGQSLTFMIGDGTEDLATMIRSTLRLVIGRTLEDFIVDLGACSEALIDHHQRRWLGQGGAHRMACGAVLNALWDLWAKSLGMPLWELLTSLPREKLCQAIDFKHLRDVLTPDEALAMLRASDSDIRDKRLAALKAEGLRLYLTKGWSGKSIEDIKEGCRKLKLAGCRAFKAKVGRNYDVAADRAVLLAMREVIGDDSILFVDANQNLNDATFAATYMANFADLGLFAIEEPMAADDVLGYIKLNAALAPHNIGVAGGEHVPTPVIFKQLLSGGGLSLCQIDACRQGSVGDVLAVMLMANKFSVPVWPHGGGIGLCHMIRHYSIFDQICIAGDRGQCTEYIDFLDGPEVFESTIEVKNGRYVLPTRPGWGTELTYQFRQLHTLPHGAGVPSFAKSDTAASRLGGERYAKWWI